MDFLVISQVEFRQLIRNFTRNVGIKRRMSYCQGNFVVKEMTKTVTQILERMGKWKSRSISVEESVHCFEDSFGVWRVVQCNILILLSQ